MSDPAIKGVCSEARRYNFQLLNALAPIPVTSSDEYMDQCQSIFEDAKSFQRRFYGPKPKLPTSSHIRQIGEFVKKHNLKVRIIGYDDPGSYLSIDSWNGRVGIHPRFPSLHDPSLLAFCLQHEHGHFRDFRLIMAYMLKSKGNIMFVPEPREFLLAEIKLMREGLSKSDQVEFDRLQKEVLGDLGRYDDQEFELIRRYFSDLFRAGEHILDEGFEDVMVNDFADLRTARMSEDTYRRLSITNHQGERVDLLRVVLVAMIQEANLWQKFIRLPGYNPDSLRYIRPNHLRFFRLCVRGASKHFAKTSKP